MKKIPALTLLIITLTSLACNMTSNSISNQPSTDATPTPELSATTQPPVSISPEPSFTPTSTGEVCFSANIADGNLRVRTCPGLDCREAGFLISGDQVTTNGERKDMDGTTWLRLLSPIEGWANSRYICQSE